jgi:hypothetical protein
MKRRKNNNHQREANTKHNLWLAKRGLLPTRSRKKLQESLIPSYKIEDRGLGKLSNDIPVGIAPKLDMKVYNGQRKLLGIAVLHKSNLVPVFSKKDAEDIAKMRRG